MTNPLLVSPDPTAPTGAMGPPPGAGPSPWLTEPQSPMTSGVHVRAFGAAGDGRTDDTAALQAAINAAQANNGEVILPAGIFMVSAPLNISQVIKMRGVGDGTVIRASAAMSSVLNISIPQRGCFEDFKIDGNNLATYCIYQSVAAETSVGTRFYKVKATGSTDYQWYNLRCEDVTYLDCAVDGNEGAPNTVKHALYVNVPNGNVRVIGGEFFGRCQFNFQQAVVIGSTIGPIFVDNPGARTDSILSVRDCYLYDGGVDNGNCITTATNLCNMSLEGVYFVSQTQVNFISGNLPTNTTVRLRDCMFIQTPGLGLPANPAAAILSASGAGRVVLDGGGSALAAGGSLKLFNAVAAATTVQQTIAGCSGVTVPATALAAGAQAASATAGAAGLADAAGSVTATALAAGMAAGAIATITFGTPYGATPHGITIADTSAVALGLYVSAKSATGFTVSCRSAATASQALSFDYAVTA